jgi:hypothetical protein
VQPEPLDLSIPTDSCAKTITYFILLPIVFPLWLTLPDTRKQSCKSVLLRPINLVNPIFFSPWPCRGAAEGRQKRRRRRTSRWT